MNPNPWHAKRSTRELKTRRRGEKKKQDRAKTAPFFGSNLITRSCSIKRESGQSQFYTSTQPYYRLTKLISWFSGFFSKLRSLISEE